jgi:hypothetical protein
MPEELAEETAALKSAAEALDTKFGTLLQERGVESEF